MDAASPKAQRRAAAAYVAAYHEDQLGRLLQHVRDGMSRYEAGELDAFGLDAVIHTRAARELWKLCAVAGAQVETVATLKMVADGGEEW